MEHRYETRKPIELTVDIAAFGREVGRFRTRDVSYSGMYIDCPDPGVSRNGIVELTVTYGTFRFTMQAIVIHRSGHGIGLMRLDYNEGYAQFLMNDLDISGPHVIEDYPDAALGSA